MPLFITSNLAGGWKLALGRSELSAVLRAMLVAVNKESSSLELSIVDDCTIAALNRQFMNCSGPTNILSFPAGGSNLGSLALSADTVWRECFLYGQEAQEYTVHLLAHGVAHLLGYDHSAEMDTVSHLLFQKGQQALLEFDQRGAQ